MKKILTLVIIVLISSPLFSQASNSNYDIFSRTVDINQKSLAFGLTEAQFNAIKDEAYANPSFLFGTIYQGEKIVKSNVPMRYNAYADEVEVKKSPSDEDYGALTKDPEIFVKIGLDLYLFVPFEGSNEKGGYFNVLTDGKNYDLYKKTTATYREPRSAKTSYERDIPPSFSRTVKYYLVQNGTFLEMPSSSSKVLKMMDSKKSEIKDYIKKNDIDLDIEKDMIKLVSYFDSLL